MAEGSKRDTFLVEPGLHGSFHVHVYYHNKDRKAINKDLREMTGAKWRFKLFRWEVQKERQPDLRKLLIKYGQLV